jgi:Matrixin/Glucodextranase, domain B
MNALRAAISATLFVASCAWAQPTVHLKASQRPRLLGPVPRGNHYILRFRAYPDTEMRDELARRGIRVLQYVPDNALMVSSSAGASLSGLPILGAGSLDTAEKMSPLLAEQVSGAILAIFHPDVAILREREIARSLGFDIISNSGLLPNQLVLAGPIDRVAALAAFDEIAYVLPASPDLAAGAPVAGCAGAMTEAGAVGEYALVGEGWSKDLSGKVALGYSIRSLTDKIDPAAARAEIERALREWTRYADVTLTSAPGGGSRNIDIVFARGAHGDPYPFDGPGRTLAHTFYPAPPNPEPVAGDVHLDADEAWAIGANVDLFSVALHEAGHALGLGHSDRPGSVMYPYYRQASGLSDDDIAAIRALYGSSSAPQNPVTPPAGNPPIQPPGGTPTQPPVTNPSGSDTAPPTIAIRSPAFTIISTNSATLSISGTAADNVGIASVTWSTSTGDSGTASGTSAWSATVPLLRGTTVVTVRAFDAAGNSGWRSITVVRR